MTTSTLRSRRRSPVKSALLGLGHQACRLVRPEEHDRSLAQRKKNMKNNTKIKMEMKMNVCIIMKM